MYRWYAKVYGWTQRVVDEEISDDMYEWYPLIEEAESRAVELERQRAKADERRGRHTF
jgi:hypothetical protein